MAAKKRSVEHDDSDFERRLSTQTISISMRGDDDDDDDDDDEGEAAALAAGHRHDYYTRRLPELDDEADLDDTADVGADHRPTWTVETLLQRLATRRTQRR
jgi:hypothetical protein